MLTYMNFGELLVKIQWYFETKRAENLEQWRMIRRLCFYQHLTGFGKIKINSIEPKREEDLWNIEGDIAKEFDFSKIEKWRKWMVDNGKMKGQA